jgi:hypothetical protein
MKGKKYNSLGEFALFGRPDEELNLHTMVAIRKENQIDLAMESEDKMTDEKDTQCRQWLRYRSEIQFLLISFPNKAVKEYFSAATIEEVMNKPPFEGIEDD